MKGAPPELPLILRSMVITSPYSSCRYVSVPSFRSDTATCWTRPHSKNVAQNPVEAPGTQRAVRGAK